MNAPRSKSVCTIGPASMHRPQAEGSVRKITICSPVATLLRIATRFFCANWLANSGKITVAIAVTKICCGKPTTLTAKFIPAIVPSLIPDAK